MNIKISACQNLSLKPLVDVYNTFKAAEEAHVQSYKINLILQSQTNETYEWYIIYAKSTARGDYGTICDGHVGSVI